MGAVVHQVKKGDNLWTLARKYGVKVEDIAKANNIKPNSILQLGQKLVIPVKTSASSQPTSLKGGAWIKLERDDVRLRQGPGTNHKAITTLKKGTQLKVLGSQGDWRKVALSDGRVGWIRSDMLPKIGSAPSKVVKKSTLSKSNNSKPSQKKDDTSVVEYALSHLGARYRYGGMSSRGGFDCSGFVAYIYKKYGVNLPHSSSAQFRMGKPVSRKELQPGDLVFFNTRGRRASHVGIYIGNGKFIHSSSARGRVRIDTLDSGYYKERFLGGRRLK